MDNYVYMHLCMCVCTTYVCTLYIMRRIYHVHLPFQQIIKFIAYTVYLLCISTRCYCFFCIVVVAVAFCIFSELQQEKRPTAKSKQQ